MVSLITATCKLLFLLILRPLLACLPRQDLPSPKDCALPQALRLCLLEERFLARSTRPQLVVLVVPTLRTVTHSARRVW